MEDFDAAVVIAIALFIVLGLIRGFIFISLSEEDIG